MACAGSPVVAPREAAREPGPPPVSTVDTATPSDESEVARVKLAAQKDYPCDTQSVYVRSLRVQTPVQEGRAELYAAEYCRRYQVYKLDAETKAVARFGVDVYAVVAGNQGLRIVPVVPTSGGGLAVGTRMALVSRKGVVCAAGVTSERSPDGVQDIVGCDADRSLLHAAVAIRAEDATPRSRLAKHWLSEPVPGAAGGDPVGVFNDGAETQWRPRTVLDLTGDGGRSVAVYCRQEGLETTCERFMVYDKRAKGSPGFHLLVSRAWYSAD